MGAAASSVAGSWVPSNLIDGGGLDGSWEDLQNGFCAHTQDGGGMEWFSLELESPKKVTRVQIANRVDGCCWERGQNIRISIGPSEAYDQNEPLCLSPIPELSRQPGLHDYACTGDLHEGKFVKISRAGILNLCEVKVFITSPQGKWTYKGSGILLRTIHEPGTLLGTRQPALYHLRQISYDFSSVLQFLYCRNGYKLLWT